MASFLSPWPISKPSCALWISPSIISTSPCILSLFSKCSWHVRKPASPLRTLPPSTLSSGGCVSFSLVYHAGNCGRGLTCFSYFLVSSYSPSLPSKGSSSFEFHKSNNYFITFWFVFYFHSFLLILDPSSHHGLSPALILSNFRILVLISPTLGPLHCLISFPPWLCVSTFLRHSHGHTQNLVITNNNRTKWQPLLKS